MSAKIRWKLRITGLYQVTGSPLKMDSNARIVPIYDVIMQPRIAVYFRKVARQHLRDFRYNVDQYHTVSFYTDIKDRNLQMAYVYLSATVDLWANCAHCCNIWMARIEI